MGGWRILAVTALMVGLLSRGAMAQAPEGEFADQECVKCHLEKSPAVVEQWRASEHGAPDQPVTCVDCHGGLHKLSAQKARPNGACIRCHDREGAIVHSYRTSKHGVIARLERVAWDWTQPLAEGNYRAPTCAYCHLHSGGHDVGAIITSRSPKARDKTEEVCADCHSPRFITTYLTTGERMYQIGLMKVREASALVERFRKTGPDEDALADMDKAYEKMKSVHLKNLLLGIAHQSPDYQWWHGHPALDGDLIRIKSIYMESAR
ncbi:MAG: multiheme c-type cytochrome [Nitrospinota bacterium]|nr:multiheme c-type cytochrome [Nitrospinota bacterium]